MQLHLAQHYGMCFGVRDALQSARQAASLEPVTILGPLVHNPVAVARLQALGAIQGSLDDPSSAPTQRVLITAHGASDRQRELWTQAGHTLTDTTCPLVHKAHRILRSLVLEGFHPVVIGQANHVEVRGLTGDFPEASILLSPEDIAAIPEKPKLGIIAQTTQPIERVQTLVSAVKAAFPEAEVRFVDTVCQPTKQRQAAVEILAKRCPVVVVVGGKHSNNTHQLAQKIRNCGALAYSVETAEELNPEWFQGVENVGLTAGTSTLDETVQAVTERLCRLGATLAH
ncbi:MAG: 4-hydroxy-3-methylbut-2-enyl diphosphate reductase [Verrucomicrobiota bacterium]|jgi:4-hydroxy-3-methylbut-2-enyl diphosphate reductase